MTLLAGRWFSCEGAPEQGRDVRVGLCFVCHFCTI